MIPIKYILELNANFVTIGLAIWPTWLVVRDHNPIEHDKEAAKLPHCKDEEQNTGSLTEKEAYVTSEAIATK